MGAKRPVGRPRLAPRPTDTVVDREDKPVSKYKGRKLRWPACHRVFQYGLLVLRIQHGLPILRVFGSGHLQASAKMNAHKREGGPTKFASLVGLPSFVRVLSFSLRPEDEQIVERNTIIITGGSAE